MIDLRDRRGPCKSGPFRVDGLVAGRLSGTVYEAPKRIEVDVRSACRGNSPIDGEAEGHRRALLRNVLVDERVGESSERLAARSDDHLGLAVIAGQIQYF